MASLDKFYCPWCRIDIAWAKKGGWAQQPAPDAETAVHWIRGHDFANHFGTPAVELILREGGDKAAFDMMRSYKALIREPMDLGAFPRRVRAGFVSVAYL